MVLLKFNRDSVVNNVIESSNNLVLTYMEPVTENVLKNMAKGIKDFFQWLWDMIKKMCQAIGKVFSGKKKDASDRLNDLLKDKENIKALQRLNVTLEDVEKELSKSIEELKDEGKRAGQDLANSIMSNRPPGLQKEISKLRGRTRLNQADLDKVRKAAKSLTSKELAALRSIKDKSMTMAQAFKAMKTDMLKDKSTYFMRLSDSKGVLKPEYEFLITDGISINKIIDFHSVSVNLNLIVTSIFLGNDIDPKDYTKLQKLIDEYKGEDTQISKVLLEKKKQLTNMDVDIKNIHKLMNAATIAKETTEQGLQNLTKINVDMDPNSGMHETTEEQRKQYQTAMAIVKDAARITTQIAKIIFGWATRTIELVPKIEEEVRILTM